MNSNSRKFKLVNSYEEKNRMNINSCNEYKISLSSKSSKKYTLTHSKSNATHFQNPDTKDCLKIYIFVDRKEIIYVGTTNQSMSSRLSSGLGTSSNIRLITHLSFLYLHLIKYPEMKLNLSKQKSYIHFVEKKNIGRNFKLKYISIINCVVTK